MKSFVKGYLAGLVTIGTIVAGVAYADSDAIKLIVNGKQIQSDIAPQVIDGHTMVPIRVVGEALGAKVAWDQANNAVVINSTGGTPTDLPSVGGKPTNLPTQSQVQSSQSSPILGDWKGTYNVYTRQGLTGLKLTITKVDGQNVEGTVNISPVASNPTLPYGSFKVRGTFDDSTHVIQLKGTEWINQPSGWSMVDFSGTIDSNSNITGKVLSNGASLGDFQIGKN